MRATVPATLLLAATLVAGCTGNDEGAEGGGNDAPTPPSSAETSQEPEPTGFLVERPAYSFHLPEGWEDTTEEHLYVSNKNSFYGRELSSAMGAGRMSIDHEADVPFGTLEAQSGPMLKTLATAHPGITWGKNTEWTGVPSLHAVAPGLEKGTTFQAFYMIRDGDSLEVQIQTRGGRKASQRVADQIESTWEWK